MEIEIEIETEIETEIGTEIETDIDIEIDRGERKKNNINNYKQQIEIAVDRG